MKDLKDMTDKEMQIEYSYVAHTINDTDKFTEKDVYLYEMLVEELNKRGYKVTTNYTFTKND